MKLVIILTITILSINSSTALAENSLASKRMAKIAVMRCAEIQETRKIESALRVRIINEFRLDYDLDPYLRGDDFLVKVVGYGLCPDLMFQSDHFEDRLNEAKELALRVNALEEDRRRKRESEEAVARGRSMAQKLVDLVEICDLRFAKYDIKLKGNGLTIWRKMFQGNKSSNCTLAVEGSNVALIATLAGEEDKFEFRPAMYATRSAPHAVAMLNTSPRGLSKKDKKKIQRVDLVIDGFPDGYCGSYRKQCLWPDGLVISKPIYLKD
jgi:hypothetical protein